MVGQKLRVVVPLLAHGVAVSERSQVIPRMPRMSRGQVPAGMIAVRRA